MGIGTDSGTFRGLFGRYNDELKRMTSIGISNFDTLRMATEVNAGIIDMQDKIGTIENGKYGKRNCPKPATRVCTSGSGLEQVKDLGDKLKELERDK